MGLLDDAIREHLELKRLRGADPAEIERAEREALGPVRRSPEALDPAAVEPEYELHAEAGSLPHEAPEYELHDEPEQAHMAEGDFGVAPAYEPETEHGDELHEDADYGPAAGAGIGAPQYDHEYEQPHVDEHEGAYEEALPGELAETHPEPPWEERSIELEPIEPAFETPPREPPTDLAPPAAAPEPHEPETGYLEEPAPGPVHEPEPPAADRSQETVEYELEEHRAEGEEAEDVLEETPEFLQDTPEHDRLWFEQRPPRDFDFEG